MASTEDVLEQAEKLGELIAEHDVSKSMESAIKALQTDTASQRALTDLNRHAASLEEKAAQGKPIEVADKQKFEQLQQAVAMSPLLANFQRAQMDYADLLKQVDDAITGRPAGEPAGAGTPGGGAAPGMGPGPLVG